MTTLSKDALIFGLGFLNGAKATLAFGGEGTQNTITTRARAALNELIASGHAEPTDPTDSIPGREFYRGTAITPHLGKIAQDSGLNMFDRSGNFNAFVLRTHPDAET